MKNPKFRLERERPERPERERGLVPVSELAMADIRAGFEGSEGGGGRLAEREGDRG